MLKSCCTEFMNENQSGSNISEHNKQQAENNEGKTRFGSHKFVATKLRPFHASPFVVVAAVAADRCCCSSCPGGGEKP